MWPPGTAEERPFRIEEPYAYGPGVNDCRSGMLCQVYTVKVLQELGFQNYGELILVFNPDEELGAPWSGKLITELAREADVALVMEGPTFPDEFIMSRAGTMNYTLEVIGRPIHSGVAPEQGRNAILELVHKLLKIQRLESCDGIKVNLATITGGEKQGIVAEMCIRDSTMCSYREFRQPSFLPHHLSRGTVDGVLILSAWLVERHVVAELKAKGLPFVIIGAHDPDYEAFCVEFDNTEAVRSLVKHLRSEGHETFALIGGAPDQLHMEARVQGFVSALQDCGLPIWNQLIEYGDWNVCLLYTSRCV